MKTLISIRNLFKDYITDSGVVTSVLKDVNLQIHSGEFVAIMGPSGSGKSTLMNILGCLDYQTKGNYDLDGEDVQRLNSNQCAKLRNQILGFVFQGFNLLSRRSILHNVAMPMICAGKGRQIWQDRATHLLEKVGLGHRLNALPNQLSGGQQQRVAIARALANNPQIILADEPTGNLDSVTSEEIMRLFKELNSQDKITIILVTHEPDIAAHAHRLVKFHDGVMTYDGPVLSEGKQS